MGTQCLTSWHKRWLEELKMVLQPVSTGSRIHDSHVHWITAEIGPLSKRCYDGVPLYLQFLWGIPSGSAVSALETVSVTVLSLCTPQGHKIKSSLMWMTLQWELCKTGLGLVQAGCPQPRHSYCTSSTALSSVQLYLNFCCCWVQMYLLFPGLHLGETPAFERV